MEQYFMPTPLERIAAEFAARVGRLNHWVPPREQRRREREVWVREAMTVCARAFCLKGDRTWKDIIALDDFWDRKRFPTGHPPSDNQVAAMGGAAAVRRRIAEGGLGIDREIGIWNGGFFRGLRLSGALRACSSRQWHVWEPGHRDLVRDMEGMSVFNRMEKAAGRNGVRRLRRCPASLLPAEPTEGASVLAGLFAGAAIRRINDEDWLEVPASDEIFQLLDDWTVIHRPGRMFRGRAMVMVPPFYAPLFIDVMPEWSMARLLALRKPAMCPLLPAIYWDLTLRREHLPVIPFTGALPFSCSMRTFRRRGWRRDGLHRTGLQMGINGVDSRLRERIAAWFDAQARLRSASQSIVPDVALQVAAVPGIDPDPLRNGPGAEIPPSRGQS